MRGAPLLSKETVLHDWTLDGQRRSGVELSETRMDKKFKNKFTKYVQKTSCILCGHRDRMSVRTCENTLKSLRRQRTAAGSGRAA